MLLLTKLLTLLKPKPAPTAPTPQVADDEFTEAVAKTWRERYRSQLPARGTDFPANQPGQAA